jgi:outer membrane receptor protein involved in Fe transport
VRSPATRLAALLLLLPSVAFADSRVEAKRHFRTGMTLINEGKYEDGIAELLEAYAIKPHPNVLYNVARAYQNAGRIPDAIDYYRRYLATNPADAPTVQVTVERLEAYSRQPTVTPPPPAPPPAPTGKTDLEELTRQIQALNKKIDSLGTREPPVKGSAPTPATGTAPTGPVTAADDALGTVPYEETVVTASRRAQSTLEAPNATTIITGDEIRLSGVTSMPELFRRVPGADVSMMGVSSANVSFRGFNQRLSNKVIVLIDGRPEYQDFLGMTLWPSFPIGMEEIEQIEIIRGPSSALYGANAMLGVINIITRQPGSGPRGEFNGLVGSGNAAGGSYIASGGDKVRYRASVAYSQFDKWSRDYADDRPDVEPLAFDSSVGVREGRGNLVATYAFNRSVNMTVSGGVNRLFTEVYPLGTVRNYFVDGVTGYAQALTNLGPLKLKFFWNHLDSTVSPQYTARGQPNLKGGLVSNVFDLEALYGQDFELLGKHRFDVGVTTRVKRISWSFTNGLHVEHHMGAFVQDEWKLIDALRLQASYRIDRHPLINNGTPGFAQSPRVSLLWMPNDANALRVSVATAFRQPTFLESYTHIPVPVPEVTGAHILTDGNRKLRPERLFALEVGYRGEIVRLGMEWDVSAYQNQVTDQIVLTPLVRVNPANTFDPQTKNYRVGNSNFDNDAQTYLARGVELGLKLSPVDRLDLRASTSYQKIVSTNGAPGDPCGPCNQSPAFKIFGSISYRSQAGIDLSVDGSFNTKTVWVEREPSQLDATALLAIEQPLPAYAVINARINYQVIPGRFSLGVIGTHLGNDHAEHPFGNLITRRFFATATVTP